MHFNFVDGFLIILFFALIVAIIFRFVKVPIILSYVLVGILVGPHTLGWLPNTKSISEVADFGVALLMFTVGLEFSWSKLFSLRYPSIVLGGSQVLLSIIITVAIGISLGMDLIASIIIGSIVAMSSTAIVIKQLADQSELNTHHGSNAIGILLFQDLAVIPILVFIASVAKTGHESFWITLFESLAKGILAIVLILVLGRWLLKPLFRLAAGTRVVELFTMAALFVAVGAAWLTNILGLSYALGTFFAGIMLGECEYRHQIKIEIRPFRDVLLSLFFISVGMLVNITVWPQTWYWILLLVIGLIFGKMFLIILLSRIAKYDLITATRTGLLLAEGGEFGFAILTLALTHKLLPNDWGQSILAALLISFLFSPIVIRYNGKIAKFILSQQLTKMTLRAQTESSTVTYELNNHIIICGYGRVGQNIAHFLQKIKYPYIGLDLDPKIVQETKLAGDSVNYGDATHPEILVTAGIDKARAILISFSDVHLSISALNLIRNKYPKIPILVRARDESEQVLLQKSGATIIVTEIFEESLTLTHHLLQLLQVPQHKIIKLLQDVRDENYVTLCEIFPGSFLEEKSFQEYLRPIPLSEQSSAVGHTLEELSLHQIGVEVISIRRGKRNLKSKISSPLYAGDILILYGSETQLEEAEKVLC